MCDDVKRINIYIYTSKLKEKLFKINIKKTLNEFKDYLIKRVSIKNDNFELIKNECYFSLNNRKLNEYETFEILYNKDIIRENEKLKFNIFIYDKSKKQLINLDYLKNEYNLDKLNNREKMLYSDVAKTCSVYREKKTLLNKISKIGSSIKNSIVKKKKEVNRGMLFDWNDYEDDDYEDYDYDEDYE
jgi:hypothetical protein